MTESEGNQIATWNWLFDWPPALAAFVFVLIIVVISLLGTFLYTWSGIQCFQCEGGTLGFFIGIVSLFIGLTMSLIITQANSNYIVSIANAAQEASNFFSLYTELGALTNGKALQDETVAYLEYIIYVEYPALKDGKLPSEGDKIVESLIRNIIAYGTQATTADQQAMWNRALNTANQLQDQRVARLSNASYGVNNIVFWVTVIDAILLILMCWFVECSTFFRYVYATIAAVYIGTAMYLILVLPYPFRGQNAILPIPFEQVLSDIKGTPPVITTIPFCGRANVMHSVEEWNKRKK